MGGGRGGLPRPSQIPAHATLAGDGVRVGNGPVFVDAYIDFMCPFSKQFLQTCGVALESMLNDSLISLAYHPLDFMDGASTTQYSSRAASAAGAASEDERFPEYAMALFKHQPREGGPGLSDDELITLGVSIGLSEPAFARHVVARTYVEWAHYVSGRAAERGVAGTPAILVEGMPVQANAGSIARAVLAR
ncbi:DsbA family protein [Actinopolymorpha pittospori]|uniref:Protein-disulfide isomerase n=1 Tax=Actinopolymorpha pittospori TaxID=648752 RepID=A0A927MT23_9ACTN|nr:DsbA family protein [Actinopolymorpha pittospori]MBE1606114.1 protein-disulfide isomerase [Actinopolymorpha pittospori]